MEFKTSCVVAIGVTAWSVVYPENLYFVVNHCCKAEVYRLPGSRVPYDMEATTQDCFLRIFFLFSLFQKG